MPKRGTYRPLTTEGVIVDSIISVPFGALFGGVAGSLGKGALSFFSPAMASAAGNFATFAGVGMIAAPLTIIPNFIINNLLARSDFLKKHPNLASFVANTADFLITLGAVTVGAALLSASLPATLISMMIIPTALYVLNTLCNLINACLHGADKQLEHTAASLSQ